MKNCDEKSSIEGVKFENRKLENPFSFPLSLCFRQSPPKEKDHKSRFDTSFSSVQLEITRFKQKKGEQKPHMQKPAYKIRNKKEIDTFQRKIERKA